VQGKITNVVQAMWFRRKPLFVGMVDTLWALRDKTNPEYNEGLAALAKLLGNGLYGKFGMKQDRTQVVFSREHAEEGLCRLCNEEASSDDDYCSDCQGSKSAMRLAG